MPQVCAWLENLPHLSILFFIGLGTVTYWNKAGRRGRRAVTILAPLTHLISRGRFRDAIDFLVFVAVGCVVAWYLVRPETAQQGFAAGLGWTGLLSESKAD